MQTRGVHFLTEVARFSISRAHARKREYDGRRFGSYATFPLRGAHAAALVFEVKALSV